MRLSTIGLTTVIALSSVTSSGCLTYSVVYKMIEDKPAPHIGAAFLVGNVVGGAAVGLAAESQVDGAFAAGMAGWNFADLAVGFSLFVIDGIHRALSR